MWKAGEERLRNSFNKVHSTWAPFYFIFIFILFFWWPPNLQMATPPAFPSFTLVKAVTVPTPSEDQQRQLQRQHAEQLEEADPATYLTHFSKSSQPAWPSVGELIASADSTNGICLFSRQTLDFGGRITGHEDSVTHLSFAKHSPSILWSSSEDGSIRCWDLRTQALAHAFYSNVSTTLPYPPS